MFFFVMLTPTLIRVSSYYLIGSLSSMPFYSSIFHILNTFFTRVNFFMILVHSCKMSYFVYHRVYTIKNKSSKNPIIAKAMKIHFFGLSIICFYLKKYKFMYEETHVHVLYLHSLFPENNDLR